MKNIILFIMTITVTVPSFSEEAAPSLSDEALLTYASTPFSQSNEELIYLGRLNGAEVVAEFICSDLCPDYTVRVIRYELENNQSCGDVDGIKKELVIPVSIAAMNKPFCFPRVIVNNWNKYQRKISLPPSGIGAHE